MRSEKVVSISDGVLPIRTQPADCEKHGKFDQKVTVILNRELKGGCPECMRIDAAEREARAQAAAAFELRLSLTRKLGDALIPLRFQGSTLDNYRVERIEQRQALDLCRNYVATFDKMLDEGRCMVLIGKPGTGKTHLGAAIANALLHPPPPHSRVPHCRRRPAGHKGDIRPQKRAHRVRHSVQSG